MSLEGGRLFKLRQGAGRHHVDGPVRPALDARLAPVIDEVAAHPVHEPHRQGQAVVDPGDVVAEQEARDKAIGRVFGAGLVGRQVVVVEQALVDGFRPPGLFEEVADADPAGQQVEEAASPERNREPLVKGRHAAVRAGRPVARATAVEAGGAHERDRAEQRRPLGGGAGQELARERQGQGIDRPGSLSAPDLVDHGQDGIRHDAGRVEPLATLGEAVSGQVERIDAPPAPVRLEDRADLIGGRGRVDAVDQQQRRLGRVLGPRRVGGEPAIPGRELSHLRIKRQRQRAVAGGSAGSGGEPARHGQRRDRESGLAQPMRRRRAGSLPRVGRRGLRVRRHDWFLRAHRRGRRRPR